MALVVIALLQVVWLAYHRWNVKRREAADTVYREPEDFVALDQARDDNH